MVPSVTIWTSSSTRHAESLVAQSIRATNGYDMAYDSISIAENNIEEIVQKLNNAFHNLVTLTSSVSTLHIIAIIPLYEDDSCFQIETLCKACSSVVHNVSLHVIGLCNDIKNIFQTNDNTTNNDFQSQSISKLKDLCKESTTRVSYSLIDNYASNGAHIGFTLKSLSQYIAYFHLALITDYYSILSPALLSANQEDNLSIGIATLSFDKEATANQLLGLGFLSALENAGINNKEVNIQESAHQAELLLSGISNRYSSLYNQSIKPLYNEQHLNEGEVIANSPKILEENISMLKSSILNILKDTTLSFPQKEAILAMILGRDNENLRGIQYQHDGILLEDGQNGPINMYVEAFNNYCSHTKLLPKRGDFESLKKFIWNESTNEFEESPENEKALNPISEIKKIKQEILNITSFLREKQDELVGVQQAIALREAISEIKHQWSKPVGDFKDIDYQEQPLDDKYTPSPCLNIKDSVDLRKFFSPIRNQQKLGSCTSFAVASMYEAMMNRNGIEGDNIMSPAYLYYYSNILAGRPEGGSNFYEQFEILGKHGVCYDSLYSYNPTNPTIEPSIEANEDAKKHRVISAKQIPLINKSNKSETISHNHRLITSALSEGYPVGISLKIYDNLGKDGAFILHPDDSPNAKDDGWHAMVVVGYSEENNFYIVRNSWGTDFGEDGYCYIPTAYIDDSEYLNFACIITEISDNATGDISEIPSVLANFGATESEIKIAAIRNVITKVRIDLKSQQQIYAEYYKYYQQLVQKLTIPNVQNEIRQAAENAQLNLLINTQNEKTELTNSFVGKLNEYKNSIKILIISLILVTLVLGLLSYFCESAWLGILTSIGLGLTIFSIIGYKWWKRIKRNKLQEEINIVAKNINEQEKQLSELKIKFHIAGMWINQFHKLSSEIGIIYDRLVSFNDTLRAWQKKYSTEIANQEPSIGLMFRTLDPTPMLNSFFEANKNTILQQIDLLELFDDYKADPQDLDNSHENLCKSVKDAIHSLMASFNITNYLLGDNYSYLQPTNLQNEISSLITVGQPSFRNRAMNATPPIRILMANVEPSRVSQWRAIITPYFPLQPIHLDFKDKTTLILITIHPQVD